MTHFTIDLPHLCSGQMISLQRPPVNNLQRHDQVLDPDGETRRHAQRTPELGPSAYNQFWMSQILSRPCRVWSPRQRTPLHRCRYPHGLVAPPTTLKLPRRQLSALVASYPDFQRPLLLFFTFSPGSAAKGRSIPLFTTRASSSISETTIHSCCDTCFELTHFVFSFESCNFVRPIPIPPASHPTPKDDGTSTENALSYPYPPTRANPADRQALEGCHRRGVGFLLLF